MAQLEKKMLSQKVHYQGCNGIVRSTLIPRIRLIMLTGAHLTKVTRQLIIIQS